MSSPAQARNRYDADELVIFAGVVMLAVLGQRLKGPHRSQDAPPLVVQSIQKSGDVPPASSFANPRCQPAIVAYLSVTVKLPRMPLGPILRVLTVVPPWLSGMSMNPFAPARHWPGDA